MESDLHNHSLRLSDKIMQSVANLIASSSMKSSALELI